MAISDLLDKREIKKREREVVRETQTTVISEVSQSKFNQLIWSMGLVIVEGDNPETTKVFQEFNWNQRSKPVAISNACEHLQLQLSACGCRFGRDGYKLLDVHTDKHLLDFSNRKVGNFSGGSDIVLVPYKTNIFGAKFQVCVLFELKTDELVLSNGGLVSFSSQAILKLIVSWCLSHQRVMVVVTDLSSVPNAGYIPNDGNEISKPKLSFKRLKLAPFENIALETFLDFGKYLPSGSEERCDMVANIFSTLHESQNTDY
eukprot:gene19290-25150_t